MIGGVNGETGGFQVLEILMQTLISPSYLPSISWTGRGKGKERKTALNSFTQTVNIITVTVMKADSSYSSKKVQEAITYEILKRAPNKYGQDRSTTINKRNTRKTSVSSESSTLSQS